jgi:hypothetical protein
LHTRKRTVIVALNVGFLSLLVFSVSVSILAATKYISGISGNINAVNISDSESSVDFSRTVVPIPQEIESSSSSSGNAETQSGDMLLHSDQLTLTLSDADANNNLASNESPEASSAGQGVVSDEELVMSGRPANVQEQGADLFSRFYWPLYESSHYLLPITWGAVAGTLMWRGKVRSAWCKQGYDYDTFRLMARMKGSPIRVRLLSNVATAKNRLQLANELEVDWKTIDNHIELLIRNGLIEETFIVGACRYYVISEHGRKAANDC